MQTCRHLPSHCLAAMRAPWRIVASRRGCAGDRRLQCQPAKAGWPRPGLNAARVKAAASSAAITLEGLQATAAKGQLYEATLGDGSRLWLEVAAVKGPRVQLLCYGEALEVNMAAQPSEVRHKGLLPRLSDPWLRGVPGLQESLSKIRQQQQRQLEGGGEEALPSQLIALHGVSQLRLATSLEQLAAEVELDPKLWCDGTGPGDPPLTEEQSALLSAGELLAFLQGRRGVCILQLYKGWGQRGPAQQPLLRPFVLQLLQEAAGNKNLVLLGSSAPEGLGSSLLLCPRQQPFKAWAEHLAGIGVQAALVADSPFYKLLVGRILGYKEENIRHHIQSTGAALDPRVVEAVDKELIGLSKVPPQLPWTKAGKRR